ncbi:MAG: hypothetical protein IJ809_02105 [Clostridia bacterium]|nr:hypothetical protein [Clostridia bacterium]
MNLNKTKLIIELCSIVIIATITLILTAEKPVDTTSFEREVLDEISEEEKVIFEPVSVGILDDSEEATLSIINVADYTEGYGISNLNIFAKDDEPFTYVDGPDYENPNDRIFKEADILMSKYALYLDIPGKPFMVREKRTVSQKDYKIIVNILLGEIANCTFEQVNAEVSMCLNMMDAKGEDMYTLVMTPNVFSERYAYSTGEELPEKAEIALQAALDGLDFSLGATAGCTYDLCSPAGKKWFDKQYRTTKLNVSSFYCGYGEILQLDKYCYSAELGRAIKCN